MALEIFGSSYRGGRSSTGKRTLDRIPPDFHKRRKSPFSLDHLHTLSLTVSSIYIDPASFTVASICIDPTSSTRTYDDPRSKRSNPFTYFRSSSSSRISSLYHEVFHPCRDKGSGCQHRSVGNIMFGRSQHGCFVFYN
ncbi:hypothetical protein HMI55_002314 [Coelomomyces lativittatus]|nr:hypothetical protein HMI55_002314 [Coelomomyces lativittatus]